MRRLQKTVIKVLPFCHKRLISDGDTINVSITHQVLPPCGRNHSTSPTSRCLLTHGFHGFSPPGLQPFEHCTSHFGVAKLVSIGITMQDDVRQVAFSGTNYSSGGSIVQTSIGNTNGPVNISGSSRRVVL